MQDKATSLDTHLTDGHKEYCLVGGSREGNVPHGFKQRFLNQREADPDHIESQWGGCGFKYLERPPVSQYLGFNSNFMKPGTRKQDGKLIIEKEDHESWYKYGQTLTKLARTWLGQSGVITGIPSILIQWSRRENIFRGEMIYNYIHQNRLCFCYTIPVNGDKFLLEAESQKIEN